MKTILFALFVIAASPALACTYEVIEVLPTQPRSNQPIQVRVAGGCPDGCVPRDPVVTYETGRVFVTFDQTGGCILTPQRFGERATIHPLPPGTHEIVLQTRFEDRVEVIARRTVEVTDARQPFLVAPNWTRIGRLEPVLVDLSPFSACNARVCSAEITFGGMPATNVTSTNSGFLATPPPHAPGLVDVTVRAEGGTFTAKNAFRYVDANAPVDDGFFARVLFPVTFGGEGANGSSWATEIMVKNRSRYAIDALQRVNFPPAGAPALSFMPGVRRIDGINSPSGSLLFVPREFDRDLTYSTIVRNVARQGEDFGVEVPVVRERDTAPRIEIIDVPNDPSSRLLLRVYDIDGVARSLTVIAAPHSGSDLRGAIKQINLRAGAPFEPAFAAVDLRTLFPEIAPGARYQLEIFAPTRDARLWAFVSVTNDRTQRVTVLTPQHSQEAH